MGQEHDREVQGPASGPRPQRVAHPAAGTAGGLIGRPEPGMAAGREQHPGHRQVAGRVARRDVAEVDHAADLAVFHQDVRGVQVAVQPHRRAAVAGRRQRSVPHAQHRVPAASILAGLAGEQGEVGREGAGPVGQRDAAERVGRRVRRGGDVQRAEKPADGGRGSRRVEGTGLRRGHARQVRHHAPAVRVAARRYPGPFRIRDGQRQPRGQPGQPALLVGDDLRAQGTARQPRHQLIPDPVELVVPAVREERHGQPREVSVLIGEQPPHQVRRHLNLGGWHPVHRHND